MKKILLSKEDVENLENIETYDIDINPRNESERCGCDYCMSEWEWAKEFQPENKEGFKLKDVI